MGSGPGLSAVPTAWDFKGIYHLLKRHFTVAPGLGPSLLLPWEVLPICVMARTWFFNALIREVGYKDRNLRVPSSYISDCARDTPSHLAFLIWLSGIKLQTGGLPVLLEEGAGYCTIKTLC